MFQSKDIFIGTPTHFCKRYCADRFMSGIISVPKGISKYIVSNSLADASDYYKPTQDYTGHNIYFRQLSLDRDFYGHKDSIHRRIVYTMNFLRSMFLDTTCGLYISLESDVIISYQIVDEILFTLGNNPEIDILHTNCYKGFNAEQRLSKTNRITLGCTAIKRRVLDSIKFRYDENLLAAFHDAFFIMDAIASGFNAYYHPHIKVNHLRNVNKSQGWDELPREETR